MQRSWELKHQSIWSVGKKAGHSTYERYSGFLTGSTSMGKSCRPEQSRWLQSMQPLNQSLGAQNRTKVFHVGE